MSATLDFKFLSRCLLLCQSPSRASSSGPAVLDPGVKRLSAEFNPCLGWVSKLKEVVFDLGPGAWVPGVLPVLLLPRVSRDLRAVSDLPVRPRHLAPAFTPIASGRHRRARVTGPRRATRPASSRQTRANDRQTRAKVNETTIGQPGSSDRRACPEPVDGKDVADRSIHRHPRRPTSKGPSYYSLGSRSLADVHHPSLKAPGPAETRNSSERGRRPSRLPSPSWWTRGLGPSTEFRAVMDHGDVLKSRSTTRSSSRPTAYAVLALTLRLFHSNCHLFRPGQGVRRQDRKERVMDEVSNGRQTIRGTGDFKTGSDQDQGNSNLVLHLTPPRTHLNLIRKRSKVNRADEPPSPKRPTRDVGE